MASELVVINTGPLILLEKAGALGLMGQLRIEFACPEAVRRELDAGSVRGCADIRPAWLRVVPLSRPLSALSKAALDEGEAEVIELALEHGWEWVCLDDLRGRRMAAAAGLRVVGALGLLVRAKHDGIIPAVKTYTDRLLAGGAWYSVDLVERVLRGVGE